MSVRPLDLVLALSLLAACEVRDRGGPAAAEPARWAAASASAAEPASVGDGPAAGACGQAGPACGQAADDGRAEPHACSACGAEGVSLASDRVEQGVDPATGRELQRVGASLRGAIPVAVPDLLARPETHVGETIRIEGDVAAMCHHRRAWFALQQAGDRRGRTVRVVGAPAFLVPAGSVGRRARAEGTVELIDVPAPARAHLATEHGLEEPPPPARVVVLRATGAEFL